MIKRSTEIMRLLTYYDEMFTIEVIDLMWSCCREKHEDIVRATFDLIQDLTLTMSLERLAYLYSKI